MGIRHIFSRRRAASAPAPAPSPSPSPSLSHAAGDQDWKPGDMAECVATGIWVSGGPMPRCGPAYGEVRVVERVLVVGRPKEAGGDGTPLQFLFFARYGVNGYEASAFRKVTPRADRLVAGDRAWLDQLLGRGAVRRPAGLPLLGLLGALAPALALALATAPASAAGLLDCKVSQCVSTLEPDPIASADAARATATEILAGPVQPVVFDPLPPVDAPLTMFEPAVPIGPTAGAPDWATLAGAGAVGSGLLACLLWWCDGGSAPAASATPQELPPGPAPGAVPEPSTWAMILLGFAAIGAAARHKVAKAGRAGAAR